MTSIIPLCGTHTVQGRFSSAVVPRAFMCTYNVGLETRSYVSWRILHMPSPTCPHEHESKDVSVLVSTGRRKPHLHLLLGSTWKALKRNQPLVAKGVEIEACFKLERAWGRNARYSVHHAFPLSAPERGSRAFLYRCIPGILFFDRKEREIPVICP